MCRSFAAALAAALTAVLLGAAPAGAYVAHTVVPGETLWSIAAANNFTTRSLAAANGLPPTARVVAGRTILIPSESQAGAVLRGTAPAAGGAPRTAGGYTVHWGDTLSAIAARNGVSVMRLASLNGLDPSGTLIAGSSLRVPSGSVSTGTVATPSRGTGENEPQTTSERISPQLVGQMALNHGVPPSLANAIAQQESGHNNALVSSANARGVMQILPSTWDYIEHSLAGGELNSASATGNVHAGVLYLNHLLRNTGNVFTATAAYYQGLGSVRRIGMLPETRRYVASVMSLRPRYGGPHP